MYAPPPRGDGHCWTPSISSHFLMTPIRSHTSADPWVKVCGDCIVAAAVFAHHFSVAHYLPAWLRGSSDSAEEICDSISVFCAAHISKACCHFHTVHCYHSAENNLVGNISVVQTISSDQTTQCCFNLHYMKLSILFSGYKASSDHWYLAGIDQ